MSFSASWLALREPYDLRARNRGVLQAVTDACKKSSTVAIVDLACGIGSTLRTLSPHLPERQDWRLVDNDLSLLARAAPASPPAGITVRTEPIDLSRDLELALDGPLDLVTTSALLDLVSGEWLERLVIEIAARNLPLYAALIYDGRVSFDPALADDVEIVDAVNRHQKTDKGFGPALGPAAAGELIARFEAIDYRVDHGPSDWMFGPDDIEIQKEVVTGWAAAAREIGGVPVSDILRWIEARHEAITERSSSITVGHADVFARPKPFR